MFGVTRLILIDSHKPGTLQEVRLDGPTNLNGVNGAGKTSLLRLIPLFFGESPNRLVPKKPQPGCAPKTRRSRRKHRACRASRRVFARKF